MRCALAFARNVVLHAIAMLAALSILSADACTAVPSETRSLFAEDEIFSFIRMSGRAVGTQRLGGWQGFPAQQILSSRHGLEVAGITACPIAAQVV